MSDFSFASGDSLLERFTILRQCYQWKGTEIYRVMDSQNDCEAYLVLTNPDTRPLFLEGRADAVGLSLKEKILNCLGLRFRVRLTGYRLLLTPLSSLMIVVPCIWKTKQESMFIPSSAVFWSSSRSFMRGFILSA